jgi:hypothetical protein
VEETEPVQGSTNVTDNEVRIVFNEYVNRQSFTDALHISPLMPVQPEVEWSGTEVLLRFPDGLLPDRTYVITIGSKVADVNGGNQMTKSVNLAFSTGDSLDQGSFRGRVFDVEPSGVSILAYQLDRRDGDTLNPSVDLPDYAQQTGSDGSFVFTNVARGTYRVFAVRDRQSNFLYDVEADDIGMPRREIAVSDSTPFELRFRLAKEDTTAPYIQSLLARNGRFVTVKFSEAIATVPFPFERFALRDSSSGGTVHFLSAYDSPDGKLGHVLYADTVLTDGKYYVEADSLPDAAGNTLVLSGDSLLVPIFEPGVDTLRPQLVYLEPSNGSLMFPCDSSIDLRFSEPMLQSLSGTIADSNGTAMEFSPLWLSTNRVLLQHPPFEEHMHYTLCLDLSSMSATGSGRAVGDTTLCVTFSSDAEEDYGALVGKVIDEDSTTIDAVVTVVEHKEKRPARRRTATAPMREFRFGRTLPETYRIGAIIDEDGNGRFSPGKAFPFTPAERFGMYPDTVRVRARWETNEVLIRIPGDRAQPSPDSLRTGVPVDTLHSTIPADSLRNGVPSR